MSCYLPLYEQNDLLKEEIRVLREELKYKEELIEELSSRILELVGLDHARG